MTTFNFDNFYFTPIDIKNYDSIIKEVRSYIVRVVDISKEGIIGVDPDDFKNNCPTILSWFIENNIELIELSTHVLAPRASGGLHADNDGTTGPRLSLNMDIINCSAPKTEFYEVSIPPRPMVTRQGYSFFLYDFDENTCKKVTEYDLSKPVILNISKPHMVTNRTPSHRIALTMRFKTDPVHLITGRP